MEYDRAIGLRETVLSFSTLHSQRYPEMQNLFQPEAAAEVISRIDKLQPSTQRQWGKMEVAQMMAHCSATLDMASGKVVVPRMLIGRILGPLARSIFTDEKTLWEKWSHQQAVCSC